MKVIKGILNISFKTLMLFCICQAGQLNANTQNTPVLEGGFFGNGADTWDHKFGRVWFAEQNRIIQACFIVNSNFGLNEYQVKQILGNEITLWQKYLVANNIPLSLDVNFYPCHSEEDKNGKDIVFYFGGKIPGAEIGPLNKPLSLARRTAIPEGLSWSQGFIWIAANYDVNQEFPRWSSESLGLVLRHELGHILGVGHVDGTVMMENISSRVRVMQWGQSAQNTVDYSGIDWQSELCNSCTKQYAIIASKSFYQCGEPSELQLLKSAVEENLIIGKSKSGLGGRRINFLNGSDIVGETGEQSSDDDSEQAYTFNKIFMKTPGETTVIKGLMDGNHKYTNSSTVFRISLETNKGSFLVFLKENAGTSPLSMEVFDQNMKTPCAVIHARSL